jgi:hypothetical protein
MTPTKRLVDYADYIVAAALFAVIATLNFLLFTESAGSRPLFRVIYGTLSFVLDGTEAVLWIRGVRARNALFMGIALAIACVSLFSSTGAALLIATADDGRREAVATAAVDNNDTVKEAQDAVAAWQQRLALVPADYTTQLREISGRLAEATAALRFAREARQRALSQPTAVGASVAAAPDVGMFSLIARRLATDESTVKLAFLLVVSVLLQTGALATTYHSNAKKEAVDVKNRTHVMLYVDQQGVEHISNNGGVVVCGKPMRYMSVARPGAQYRVCDVCFKGAQR